MNRYQFLLLLTLLAGCNKPSYIYRFQNKNQVYYSSQSKSPTETESVTILNEGNITTDNSLTADHKSINSTLLASASHTSLIYKIPDVNLPAPTSADETTRPGILYKSTLAANKPVTPDDEEGDPKKNTAAKIGLAFSLASLTILFGFVLAPVFAIPAIIFCVIGLKSEKKKMAKTGLILSIAVITLGLFYLIYLAAVGGYGM